MAKKKSTRKKSTTKTDTDKAREAAIKEIDQRLNGDSDPKPAAKKKASTRKPPAKKKAKAPRKPSGLDLAAKVLQEAMEPLKAKEIAERAIAAGWETKGATPHATLYAAMIREIGAKGKDARFVKADRGLFAFNAKKGS